MGVDPGAVADIVIAVNEAVANIIRHGYDGRPGPIALSFMQENSDLIIIIEDQAPPFNPLEVGPPDTSLPLDKRPFGGMGIYLMRHYCDKMSYQLNAQGKNELTLRKTKAFVEQIKEE